MDKEGIIMELKLSHVTKRYLNMEHLTLMILSEEEMIISG